MIKILKHGKTVPIEAKYRAICGECQCEFSFEEEDTGSLRSPNKMEFGYINCPECKHTIWL